MKFLKNLQLDVCHVIFWIGNDWSFTFCGFFTIMSEGLSDRVTFRPLDMACKSNFEHDTILKFWVDNINININDMLISGVEMLELCSIHSRHF